MGNSIDFNVTFCNVFIRLPGAFSQHNVWPGPQTDSVTNYEHRAILDWKFQFCHKNSDLVFSVQIVIGMSLVSDWESDVRIHECDHVFRNSCHFCQQLKIKYFFLNIASTNYKIPWYYEQNVVVPRRGNFEPKLADFWKCVIKSL